MKLEDKYQIKTGLCKHKYTNTKYMIVCIAATVANILDRRVVIQQLEDNKDFWLVPEKEFSEMYERL